MKVVPRSPFPEGQVTKKDYRFKDGDVFIVLAIFFDQRGIWYRIFAEGMTNPALYPAELFNVVSSQIPSAWIANVSEEGNWASLEPQSWAKPGFWEDFFDRSPHAMKIFEEESYKIVAEEN